MNIHKKKLCISAVLLVMFGLWTYAIRSIDLQPIGPEGSMVGFAALNSAIHNLTGVHFMFYTLTDWLSLIPLGICAGFGVLGLCQWFRRRHLLKVDSDILALGFFYTVVMAVYTLFEICVINYRPVLIQGILEASYPSSTTMLVICVMSTAVMQFRIRIRNFALRRTLCVIGKLFLFVMVSLRLFSGVHWFTDIVGGIILSAALVTLYCAVFNRDK